MGTIAEWLTSLGLSEYAERFAENGVDVAVLRDLTDQDLKDLGVLLGHRRKTLRAIAELDRVALTPPQAVTVPLRHDAERRYIAAHPRRTVPEHNSFDYLIGAGEKGGWNRYTKFFCCSKVDYQFECRWLFEWQVRRARSPQNLVHVGSGTSKLPPQINAVTH